MGTKINSWSANNKWPRPLPKVPILFGLALGFACIAQSGMGQLISLSTDSSELRDITGIEEIPVFPFRPWWPYGLGVAVVLLTSMFLAGWNYWRRYFGESEAAPGPWALELMRQIDSLNLPDAGQVDKYHQLYSEVIRQYLEKKFQVRASRQTTPEYLQAIGASSLLDASQKNMLKEFLERCDLAKFAQIRFPKEDCQALGQSARIFVVQTSEENSSQ